MVLAVLSASGKVAIIAGAAFALWLAAAIFVATYGSSRGFRFWPLLIAAAFLGFPLVLLGITLAAGPEQEVSQADHF